MSDNSFAALFRKAGGVREFAPPVLAGAFFAYQLVSSFSLKVYSTDVIGSNFMPRVTGSIGLACILGIIVSKFAGAKKIAQEPIKVKTENTMSFMGFVRKNNALVSIILIGIYIALMKPLGFLLSSFLYLSVQILLLAPEGKRKPIPIIALSAVFSAATYFLFVRGFTILLPPGILG